MRLRLMTEGSQYTLYAIEQGSSVCKFLAKLEKTDPKGHAQIMRRLVDLANTGATKNETKFRTLRDGLFEAKARSGPRVFFFYDEGSIVVCVSGLIKQSQKTPQRNIETALERKKAYFNFKETGRGFEILIARNDQQPRRRP